MREFRHCVLWPSSSLDSLLPPLHTLRAHRYQKNTGRRACIFLLLLIIFGLIIVLIFKPRRHSSSSPTPISDPLPSPVMTSSDTPNVDWASMLLLWDHPYGWMHSCLYLQRQIHHVILLCIGLVHTIFNPPSFILVHATNESGIQCSWLLVHGARTGPHSNPSALSMVRYQVDELDAIKMWNTTY